MFYKYKIKTGKSLYFLLKVEFKSLFKNNSVDGDDRQPI